MLRTPRSSPADVDFSATSIERSRRRDRSLHLRVGRAPSPFRALRERGSWPARVRIGDDRLPDLGRAVREVAAELTAALGGLDALIFTGGIGEHAVEIRARVCHDAEWLGVRLDDAANAAGGPRISGTGSAVSVLVVATDENLMIARHTRRLLDNRGA